MPKQQSIDRAELLALLQVCHDATTLHDYTCVAFSDSQYAIDVIESWDADAHEASGRGPPPNFDLMQSMRFRKKPRNLEVRKIKAHQDLAKTDLKDLRHVLGNTVADQAARNAREKDFGFVVDLASEIGAWHSEQAEALGIFLQFNLELTKSVKELENLQRITGHGSDGVLRYDATTCAAKWLSRSIEGAVQAPTIDLPITWPLRSRWPQEFLAAIWVWQQGLAWPAPPIGRLQRGDGVTFLEMMLNFIAVTRTLPPVKGNAADAMLDPLSPEGVLQPLILKDLVSCFVSAVDWLGKYVGDKIWRLPKHHRIYSLIPLGERSPRKGLVGRPGFQQAEQTARLVAVIITGENSAEGLRDFALTGTS